MTSRGWRRLRPPRTIGSLISALKSIAKAVSRDAIAAGGQAM
jgi:hypothetical protein